MFPCVFHVCMIYTFMKGLPGFIKVFPSVSHPTGHTKTLPQRSSGYIHNLLLLKCTQIMNLAWMSGNRLVDDSLLLLSEIIPEVWYNMWQLTEVGWPSRVESTWHKLSRSLSFRKPVSTHMEYKAGAAWPWGKRKMSVAHLHTLTNTKGCPDQCMAHSPWTGWSGRCWSFSGHQGGTSWYGRKAQTWSLPHCSMM